MTSDKFIRRSGNILALFCAVLAVSFAGKAVLHSGFLKSTSGMDLEPAKAQNKTPEQYPMVPSAECDVDVELVMDISGSMMSEVGGRQRLDWAKEAAQAFIAEMGYIDGLPENDVRVGLTSFGAEYFGAYNSAVIRQPLTSTWYLVRNAVADLTAGSGFGTCIECGLRAGRADLFNNIEDPDRPKVVVMLSDGYGNRNLASENTVVALTSARASAISESFTGKRSGVLYFVVGYGAGASYDSLTLTGVSNDPDSVYYSYSPNVEDWLDNFRQLAIKVCDRPTENSCTVASTHASSSTSPLVLASGNTTQIGTNFTNFTPSGGSAEVRYSLTNSGVVNISPAGVFNVPDPSGATSYSYYFTRVNVTPLSSALPGSTTALKADVYIGGELSCSATTYLAIQTTSAKPWWQVGGGDIVAARGNISSDVPTTAPAKMLISKSYFGVPIFEGVINPGNSENIGVPGWVLNTRFVSYLAPSGTNYNYGFFAKKFAPPANINQALISSADYFNSSGLEKDGYQLYLRNGSLDLGTLNFSGGLNKKIIIFVNGNVNLNGKITLDDGLDFFMLIARGNIVVSSSVGDAADVNPASDLEGIFVTDNEFNTSAGENLGKQLVVRGIVVGWGSSGAVNGVNFKRDIGSANSVYAAEIFEYAPDLILNFPPFYGEKTITWKEVSP